MSVDVEIQDAESPASRVAVIIQARLGSVRFPRKVLAEVLGKPNLVHLIERLKRAELVDEIILAVPDSPGNDDLAALALGQGILCHRGDEFDVLQRYGSAAALTDAGYVVRITGDCPLVDPKLVDAVISRVVESGADYGRTALQFPDGFDVEVFTRAVLERAVEEAAAPAEREHVTPFMQTDPSTLRVTVESPEDYSNLRVTLDEQEDYEVITAIFSYFGDDRFGWSEVVDYLLANPAISSLNSFHTKNEGGTLLAGEKLWRRAQRVIPGGNSLLSKRAELHLPSGWPSYFSKTSGCRVWGIDNSEYIDVGYMGIGTNILGFSHPEVDAAVHEVVSLGNMSTLNCPEEVVLAEELIRLHPWSEMARFTRSGGEACAMAVRIGRAASGKNGVAVCGYHGWHDWYLAANLSDDDGLAEHLLPGLSPVGIPKEMAGLTRVFAYNDLAALEEILADGQTGVVMMEVERTFPPLPGFLDSVRALVSKAGAVLIFDECTSGFRQVIGGTHLVHDVEPDLMVLGKTLGNGYAVNAILGRGDVMCAATETFISSTFWTERIGSAAALATLRVMTETDAPARVHAIGLDVRRRWHELATAVGLTLETAGLPAIGTFSVAGLSPLAVKTFVTQEMLKAGYLASTAMYASIAHTPEVLDQYFETLSPVFERLAAVDDDDDLLQLLPNGLAHAGFKRTT